ncbi:hypothetical protein IFM89_001769 [Coptis chinensis]|uniref:Uncharacterized protein n=1 Tax=Coptis chinensis TaxID=261450 RepID=A0A835HKN3_9MAGN|nr:hypothetical protein IFM89_001769 [Coptis chinensis]
MKTPFRNQFLWKVSPLDMFQKKGCLEKIYPVTQGLYMSSCRGTPGVYWKDLLSECDGGYHCRSLLMLSGHIDQSYVYGFLEFKVIAHSLLGWAYRMAVEPPVNFVAGL